MTTSESLSRLVEPARVHASVYVDPDIFDLEMDRLWGRAWIYVGHESQVPEPGDFFTTTVATRPVVMVRDAKRGEVTVLLNRCGHRGAMVVQRPHGNAKSFRCPYHGWIFRTDGCLHAVPHPRGYEGTGFDRDDPAYAMPALPKVASYRGFVFASLDADAPPLAEFLGDIADTIDNLCDRAPEGTVEVTGRSCHRFLHPCNWKFFVENLHDAMHPMCAHAATSDAVRSYLKTLPEGAPPPPEAEVIDPFGGSYAFFDDMGVTALDRGHGYMGGQKSIFSHYEMYPEYLAAMHAARGEERTAEILSFNRHNACCYPSCTIRDGVQSVRVVRPLSVDSTIVESWTFRLEGAPDALLARTLRYSRLINSPGSMVGPDDLDCYYRIHEAAKAGSIEWVDLHRYLGTEEAAAGGTRAAGTSDLAIRNQYRAWLEYLSAAA